MVNAQEELPMGSPPKSNMFKVKSLGKSLLKGSALGSGHFGSGGFSKAQRRHTVGDLSGHHSASSKSIERSRSHSVRYAELCLGIAVS